jgi:endonuclease/exonuclease/phosphatase (EEP) superfamily protein YafD
MALKARRRIAPLRRVLGRTLRAVLSGGLWIGLCGLLLRLTVRDGWPAVAMLYYATPPFVIAGLGLGSAWAAWWSPRPRRAAVGLALAIVSAVLGAFSHYSWHAPSSAEHPIRIAVWNVARGVGGWRQLGAHVRDFDADIVGLVEAGWSSSQQTAMWREALPEYQSTRMMAGLIILTRGEVEILSQSYSLGYARYQIARVAIEGRALIVVLVDVSSSLWISRRKAFVAIREALLPYRDQPLLLLGDFNTPPESCWFDGLRGTMANALESAGNGYTGTWPSLLPVLRLDQIWTAGVRAVSCEVGFSWRSDHRPVVATIDWAGLAINAGGVSEVAPADGAEDDAVSP